MRKFWSVLFVCLFPLFVWAQPSEQDIEKAKKLFEAATVHYQDKSYEQALLEYQNAYKVAPLPFILFNVAQCYRFLGRHQEARDTYAQFLREDPDTEYRAEVEAKLVALDAEIAKLRSETQPASLVVSPSSSAPTSVPDVPEPSLTPVLYTALPAVLLGAAAISIRLSVDATKFESALGTSAAVGSDVLTLLSALRYRSILRQRRALSDQPGKGEPR